MAASQPVSERIRAVVAANPRKMTLQLARDLGVPEVEVIRAFPPERATELDISRWEELLRSLEALGPVRVLVSNGATTIEVDGQPAMTQRDAAARDAAGGASPRQVS